MEALSSSLGNLLLDDKYTDLEIKCSGESFRVHRAVVCNKSAVLAEQCENGFLVSQSVKPLLT